LKIGCHTVTWIRYRFSDVILPRNVHRFFLKHLFRWNLRWAVFLH